MSAVERERGGTGAIASAELLHYLMEMRAVILTNTPPPYRAVPFGDGRKKPVAWVDSDLVTAWRQAGYAVSDPRGWKIRTLPGPKPILADEGRVQAEVRENWMQRLARDLEIDGPLAEAGHRLVADGIRMQVGILRSGCAPVIADGRPRNSGGEEARMVYRLEARQRVREALDMLAPRERRVAEAICLLDLSLEDVVKRERLPESEVCDSLRLALLRLSKFYGTMPGLKKG